MPPSKDDLNKSFVELGSINKRQEKTVRYFEETTIRLVIAYVFTQTLIYFSISLHNPASSISCQHWWIPFCLSSLIAVIFGIGFKRFVTKWERTSYHYDMNFLERELIYHRIVLLQESQGRPSDQATTYDEEQPKFEDAINTPSPMRRGGARLTDLQGVSVEKLLLKKKMRKRCCGEVQIWCL
ncbi:hypothetical protein Pyn_13200 [Prunus yedoensis var. nudiflora]|uniref:Uncharacterized protein n=1 Tax=Prunus yedoensis var. nudiflora TaxID=2094558 RepID=A0A314UKC1_PRUYE|nr:hypothetical protein Pyn_13200 [Prunus yedoensis var. nudiflora]